VTLHDKLFPALPYVTSLLDDEDPTVRREACLAIYHISETGTYNLTNYMLSAHFCLVIVAGRAILAQTNAFPKLFNLRFDPKADVTLFDDGTDGQAEIIRLATKALQNMVLRSETLSSEPPPLGLTPFSAKHQ